MTREQMNSDFTAEDLPMLEEVRGLTGYSIPIEDDLT